MMQNLISMNEYGLFVWASFSITFIACALVFYKTRKTLKKYEPNEKYNSICSNNLQHQFYNLNTI